MKDIPTKHPAYSHVHSAKKPFEHCIGPRAKYTAYRGIYIIYFIIDNNQFLSLRNMFHSRYVEASPPKIAIQNKWKMISELRPANMYARLLLIFQ